MSFATNIYEEIALGGASIGGNTTHSKLSFGSFSLSDNDLLDVINQDIKQFRESFSFGIETFDDGSGGLVGGGDGLYSVVHFDNASGGLVGGGNSTSSVTYPDIVAAGGLVVGGTGLIVFVDISTGGVLGGGSALTQEVDTVIPTGGVVGGGTSLVQDTINIVATGGVVDGGTALVQDTIDIIATGGVVGGGTALDLVIRSEIAIGGVLGGGTSLNQQIIDVIATGGVLGGGTALVQELVDINTDGGVLGGGSQFDFLNMMMGGIEVGGDLITSSVYNVVATGGVLLGADTEEQALFDIISTGGLLIAGLSSNEVFNNIISTGGVSVGADVEEQEVDNIFAVGGSLVSGTALVQELIDLSTLGGVLASGTVSQNSNVDLVASGGILASGDSSHYIVCNILSTGGVVVGADVEEQEVDNIFAKGGVLIGGSSNSSIANSVSGGALVGGVSRSGLNQHLRASGGALLGTSFEITVNQNTVSLGGVLISGDFSSQHIQDLDGVGGAIVSGSSQLAQDFRYYSDGGSLEFSGEADVSYSGIFQLEIEWRQEGSLTVSKSFEWNLGLQPLRWYRVQGCCEFPTAQGSGTGLPGGCDVIGIETDDDSCAGALGRQQFIQNVVAHNVADVCNQLTESRLNWEICSIKEWSRPADGRLVDPDDQCNTLHEVPYCDIPECMRFCIDTDAVIHMGMSVSVLDSINFYRGSGNVTFYGTSPSRIVGVTQPVQSFFSYESDGGTIVFSGSGEVSSSWDDVLVTTMEATVYIDSIEVIFGSGSDAIIPTISLTGQPVSTNCGLCTGMPSLIYMHHNIVNDNVLVNYLQRNGLNFPNPLTLRYNSKIQTWSANHHLIGTSSDNLGDDESWRFTFEWSCVDSISGDDAGSYLWKFSMLAVKKNETTGFDTDTRLFMAFPPDLICDSISNLEFDFSFSLNTLTKFVDNDYNVAPNMVLLTDSIGLFKSKFWSKNPNFNIRLSKNKDNISVQRQNIRPIFPTAFREDATSPFITR